MKRLQPEAIQPLNPGTKSLPVARLIAHARIPLYRNAYAWMFSTGVSSALGIVYWIVAARFYSTAMVGFSSTLISGLIFLSGVAQLNLASALVRFIPVAGRGTRRFVFSSYGLTVLLSAVLSLLAVAGSRFWFKEFSFIGDRIQFTIWFITAALIWGIFSLQDAVMTGLRDATWVPVENITFSIVKILLLVFFAKVLPLTGIFISWVVPVGVAILPVNLLIFRRMIPNHVHSTADLENPTNPSEVVKFIAANYAGWLFLLATFRLVPVLVTQQAGAVVGAYFFIPWTIANSLKVVVTNMTMSLTTEGARDGSKMKKQGSRFLLAIAAVFIPGIAVLVVGAPYILNLMGKNYSAEGTLLLRLLAISIIPGMVTLVYISIAQVQNRVLEIVIIQGAFCAFVLGLSLFLLPLYGITGVGAAFLIGETIVAVVLLLVQLWRRFRKFHYSNSHA